MKILIISNKLTVEVQDDIDSAFSYLKSKTPLEYKFSYLKTDFPTQYKSFSVGNFWGTTGTKEKIAPLLKETYDVIIFLYGVQGYNVGAGGVLTGWTTWEGLNGAEFIEIPCSPFGDAVKFIEHTISHEMLHALCKVVMRKGRPIVDEMDITKSGEAYLHNDDPNHPDGNYARTLKNLAPYWDVFTTTKPQVVTRSSKYKYFNESEIKGLQPKLVQMLDNARGLAGVPFIITSGYRTVEHNKKVGGVDGSEHTTGLAVDLLVKDTVHGGKMLLGLVKAGFERFGFYADGHMHVDISDDKSSPSYWIKII
jgi:zinc D-Ala-D-Ala carboxypeptidase